MEMARKIVKYQVDEKKYSDTKEIFDSLFGKALRILFRRENLEDEAEKYEKKSRQKRKKPKQLMKDEALRGDKPEAEGESSAAESLEKLKQDEPRSDGKPRKDTEKTYQSPIKYEKAEKAKLKPVVKGKKSRRRKRMSKRQPKVGSSKRRALLAFVLFLALAGAYFYYQSGGDLGKFTESLKSVKKEAIPVAKDIGKIIASLTSKIKGIIQPEEGKKVAKKSAKKPSQIARKPMPKKSEGSLQSKEAAPQKNLLVVKKPHTPVVKETDRPAPRQSYRRAVKETRKPLTKPSYSSVVKQTQETAVEHPHIPAFDDSQKPVAQVSQKPVAQVSQQPAAQVSQKPAAQVSQKPAAQVSPRPVVEAPVKAVALTQTRKVSPPTSSLPAKPPVSYPYSIHLGSYGSPERAKKAVSMYEKKGLSPYWVEVDLGEKGVWFRIFTGYFAKKEEAEAYINEKQIRDARSKRTAYANLIGVYHSKNELNRKRLTVSELGYSPYVIPGVNGESLLYAGAFYQKARAEKQHTQLASKGIQSRVVSR